MIERTNSLSKLTMCETGAIYLIIAPNLIVVLINPEPEKRRSNQSLCCALPEMKPFDPQFSSSAYVPSIIVQHSTIHGKGVFATQKIPEGTCVVEYCGQRITEKQAAKRQGADPENPFHTFFFSLETGKMIDGAVDGNEARWINHGCAPNCEAREEDGRVFIYALRDISSGEELKYDYGLIIDERHTAAVKLAYECRCGAETCRKTMLAPKRRNRQ